MRSLCIILVCGIGLFLYFGTGNTFAGTSELPDVEIRMHNGRPTVFIDSMPNAVTAYCNFGQKRLQDTMAFFLGIGMDAYYISVARLPGDYNSNRFWSGNTITSTPAGKKPDDFYGLDEQAKFILDRDPEAWIVVRFTIRPPYSWKRINASEYFVTEEAEEHNTPSLASDAYWETAAKFSGAVVHYVESKPWAKHVIAYANFHHTEGTHMPVADGWLFDHNPGMVQRFRDYLKKKYGTVTKLQEAYDDTLITFANASVPKDRLRDKVPVVTQIPYWQTGSDNRELRDYLLLNRDLFHYRFRQLGAAMESAADRKVLFFHDALKQTMAGWNLKGFFGYPSFGEDVSWSPYYPDLLSGSGHIKVADLDGAAGYDGLVTPHDYQARGLGGVYEPEGIVDSIILRGMFFACEMDTRFRKDYGIGAARNVREAEVITWRNIAGGLTRGFNSYVCWGFQVEDWFYTEPVRKVIARQVDVMRRSLDWSHETVPGIAMILDDSAVLETNGSGNYFNEAIMWEQKMGIARCGVPFRIYLFEDLALDNFPEHRVYYFPNLFRVDDERLFMLQQKVFRDGNIVVWGPGSGISDGERIETASAKKLTGFEFEMLPANAPRRILISNFDHPVTYNLPVDTVIGGTLPYGPVLIPKDGIELGMAWVKGGMNHSGLSLKEYGRGAAGKYTAEEKLGTGDYAAVFSTSVQLPAGLWRNIARYAGANIYCETNDILMADKSVVALHSLKSGAKRIALPERYRVSDLITGKNYSSSTKEITFMLEAPETRVFLLEE